MNNFAFELTETINIGVVPTVEDSSGVKKHIALIPEFRNYFQRFCRRPIQLRDHNLNKNFPFPILIIPPSPGYLMIEVDILSKL
jgi:hypothetical protein